MATHCVSLQFSFIFLSFATIVTCDDSPLSQLRQSVFFGYDKHVIPQKVLSIKISSLKTNELPRQVQRAPRLMFV